MRKKLGPVREHLRRTAKAYIAAAVAGGSFLTPVVDDGLLASEAIGATVAALLAWQAVYWVPNRTRVARITGSR